MFEAAHDGRMSLDAAAAAASAALSAGAVAIMLLAIPFVVVGPQYPRHIEWPPNVERIEHLGPADHRAFYNECAFTLNLTRKDMVEAGWSPSVRLFEAAACGVPIISDPWDGLADLFEGVEAAQTGS